MKKIVVFLAAYLTFKKGQEIELDEKEADEVIKAGKAIEVIVDKSRDQRDHANPPAEQEEVLAKAVAVATAKAIEPLQKKLEEQAQALNELGRTKATNNMGTVPNDDAPAQLTPRRAADGSGISFVRIAKAIGAVHLDAQRGKLITLEDQLKRWGYKDEVDALTRQRELNAQQRSFSASLLTDGGSLIPEVFATEVIELLRHKTAVRKLGYRQMDLTAGNLTIGRQSAAATAAYIAEGAVISTSKPSTEQVRLSAKKLASLVPVSNDLIRQATPSAEEFVRQDLMQVMALREDLAFLRGDGTQDTPKGMRNDANTNNVYAATAVAPKVPTLAEVRTELAKAKYTLNKNDVPVQPENLAWVFSPRTRFYLELLQDGNGNNAIFATELAQGLLWGIPFKDTTQIPDNLGGGDESELYIYNKQEFMIGDHMQLEVTVDPNGTYEEGGVAKSGMSRDETPIRILSAHDCKLRHNVSAAVVTTVRWGAP